ncbi:TetR/AcrR family transcriptional regulator C-terminal ligand-binding domain-containing protein [Streptomyces caatingaensis]|uniref:TetR family transcriptional regulator n=1 Tax=Streptomyces caatingaensis TaxID=1678637 RepID=A0A0K9XHG3_9ACTN|nr:TetR/AcrR family transcriptional regulator C-terminal ligand-binding domain-containing protein [Streptomyces caatingaensis]KNB52839.1 TetR family transcriptional regulator [Streptomyces caatingaensis]
MSAAAAPDAGPLPVPPRGRPRSAAVGTAVIESVLRLLEQGVTVSELSMERIAREAGVGKATVYRRWAGKEALMLDVLRSMEESSPRLTGASVRDDLVALLDFLRRRGLAKRSSAVLRTVVAQVQAQPRIWKEYHDTVVSARREAFLAVLRRGIASGEVRGDVDPELLVDLFVSPMVARAVLCEWSELPEGLAERIVDTVLEGVRPAG